MIMILLLVNDQSYLQVELEPSMLIKGCLFILSGHADSQCFAGPGTSGESVDKFGLNPIDSEIIDEIFWNLNFRINYKTC